METPTQLANHIERAVNGPMWHGPALNELLDGVTATDAAARPIGDAHSIWELVLHITAWAEIARARLTGNRVGPIPEAEDWPAPASATPEHWSAAIDAMRASYASLARDAAALTPEQLAAKVPKGAPPHSVTTLLYGVIEHGTYHGGQIALLKRALADATRARR